MTQTHGNRPRGQTPRLNSDNNKLYSQSRKDNQETKGHRRRNQKPRRKNEINEYYA